MVDGLAVLVDEVRASAGIAPSRPVAVGAFYIANLDLPEAEREAQQAIAGRGLAARVVVGNDTLAVLHAGAPDGWGVAVVSGAGINAVGVDSAGTVARFLALGETTGDWGGGWAVSVSGIGAAVRAGDGRGPRPCWVSGCRSTSAGPAWSRSRSRSPTARSASTT